MRRCGHRFAAPSRLLTVGEEARIGVQVVPGIRIPIRTRVTALSPEGMTTVLVAGPARALTHTVTLTATAAGTLVLDEVRWTSPFGLLGRAVDVVRLRGSVLRVLAARSEVLAERSTALVARPVVVATAVLRDGAVLAAQRTRPPALAGRWELPGGRVEAGEREPEAVVRECREELGTAVRVTGRLGTDLPIDAGVLRVHSAEVDAGAPD